jgi:hypothetical protein
VQIIIPAAHPGKQEWYLRGHGLSAHNVCASDMLIAIVSTTFETSTPIAELNLNSIRGYCQDI